jgi:hypothetical protein
MAQEISKKLKAICENGDIKLDFDKVENMLEEQTAIKHNLSKGKSVESPTKGRPKV